LTVGHTTQLIIELGAVLFGLGLLSRIARRIGLSPIPLYLLAGLFFGRGGLVPLTAGEQFIAAGAEIGVILMLFMLGLEYSALELFANIRAGAPAGMFDGVLNAIPGAALALILGWGPVAAVALAGVTWVTSSGVVSKVLGDLGRIGNRETPTILSILVIEDLAMAIYLPLLTTALAGTGFLAGGLSLGLALGAVALAMVIAIRYGHLVSRVVASESAEGLLLGVLGLTLVVAGLAASVRVSAAVGAFLVGIAISGPVVENVTTLIAPLRDLFAAVFFVFFGLATDPREIPPVLVPALALVVVTMATKTFTGYLAARRAKIAVLGRWRSGLALIPRGEFSIVIAGLAVSAGTVAKLAPLSAAYVFITVVLGPILARVPDYQWFKRLVRPGTARSPVTAASPTAPTAPTPPPEPMASSTEPTAPATPPSPPATNPAKTKARRPGS
jgi:K+:H+ antiporter subunit KhtU